MRTNTARSLGLLASLLLLSACGEDEPKYDPIEQLPRELTDDEKSLIGLSNDFAFDLLREVRSRETGPNVFLSPLSASMALGMTTNGAANETQAQMRRTLGFGDLTMDQINEAYRGLIDLLVGLDPRVDYSNANSIWYREEFPFEESFFQTARDYFDAEVAGLDFTDPASLDTINGWVSQSTKGKIESIIEKIGSLDVMFLINAIYFKANWVYAFDSEDTVAAAFHCADGTEQSVMMMSRSCRGRYQYNDLFEAADLRYGGGAYSMVVLLPREDRTLDEVLAALSASQWDEWMDGFVEHEEFNLDMPRFRLEYSALLNDTLAAMGMPDAFDPKVADFTGMSRDHGLELFISRIQQKTFLDVNEAGTEAAATTAVTVTYESATPGLYIDRPFLFAIRERFSNTTLFIGTIGAPPSE